MCLCAFIFRIGNAYISKVQSTKDFKLGVHIAIIHNNSRSYKLDGWIKNCETWCTCPISHAEHFTSWTHNVRLDRFCCTGTFFFLQWGQWEDSKAVRPFSDTSTTSDFVTWSIFISFQALSSLTAQLYYILSQMYSNFITSAIFLTWFTPFRLFKSLHLI